MTDDIVGSIARWGGMKALFQPGDDDPLLEGERLVEQIPEAVARDAFKESLQLARLDPDPDQAIEDFIASEERDPFLGHIRDLTNDSGQEYALTLFAPKPPSRPATRAEICRTMETAAAEHDLPIEFFAGLIWQESRFRTTAVSPAGARGIAQFMPATAEERGLDDPFEPITALMKSAEFLRELADQFGNLGLAAAAYNGGPGRVRRWLDKKGGLPRETRDYVRIVTGLPVEEWRGAKSLQLRSRMPRGLPCNLVASVNPALEARSEADTTFQDAMLAPTPKPRPVSTAQASNRPRWLVQILAGNWSVGGARQAFARMRKEHPKILANREPVVVQNQRSRKARTKVRVKAGSQADAQKLCNGLKQAGGSCFVLGPIRSGGTS